MRKEEKMRTMEQMDNEVYNSLKSNYEFIMFQMIERAKNGEIEEARKDMKKLLEVFNNTVDGTCRLLKKVRELEAKTKG
jgi:hypothetical protein